jgi:hypothetical protein
VVSQTGERLTRAVESGDFHSARELLAAFGAEVSASLAGAEGRQAFAAAVDLMNRLRLGVLSQRAHWERQFATVRGGRSGPAPRRSSFEITG